MLKKYFFILIIFCLVLAGCQSNNVNNTNEDTDKTQDQSNEDQNYTAQKTETKSNTIEIRKNVTSTSEEEISSFSTKIYTKDSSRQKNISITCGSLDGTEVKPGETFSFCNTVGKATSSKGYEKADVFTPDGQVTKGLGGGNCQVSTTLYNAVLKVDGLKVTERHEHSNDVPYIGKGKDAAVSYGASDFKFVNNLDKSIKIKAGNSKDTITITLVSLNNS